MTSIRPAEPRVSSAAQLPCVTHFIHHAVHLRLVHALDGHVFHGFLLPAFVHLRRVQRCGSMRGYLAMWRVRYLNIDSLRTNLREAALADLVVKMVLVHSIK
jgi:hypothetical protein